MERARDCDRRMANPGAAASAAGLAVDLAIVADKPGVAHSRQLRGRAVAGKANVG